MGLVVEARSPNMDGRGGCDEAFFFGLAVEAGNRAQPPRDRRPRSTESLEMPAKRFDVGAARTEQANLVLGAPGDVLTQIKRVGLAGESAVAGQEADQRGLLLRAEQRVAYRDGRRESCCLHTGTSSIRLRLESRDRRQVPAQSEVADP